MKEKISTPPSPPTTGGSLRIQHSMSVPQSPTISVVSPFYNRRSCLADVISTLARQTFSDFEFIIVDDGSTDGLAEAAVTLSARFPIRFVRLQSNRGAAAARNAGIDAAKGRYVAFLDSDDSWHPEKLERQIRQLKSADSNLVSLTRQCVRARRNYIFPRQVMSSEDTVGSYLFLRGGVIQSSMIMLARSLAERVRFEEGSRGHDDWSFALRLEEAGARFAMLEQPLTIYNDLPGRERRSPSYSATRLAWLSERRPLLGDAPYWAAVAAVASHLSSSSDIRPLHLIGSAYREKAIGPGRAFYYGLTWLFPPVRQGARQLRQLVSGVVDKS